CARPLPPFALATGRPSPDVARANRIEHAEGLTEACCPKDGRDWGCALAAFARSVGPITARGVGRRSERRSEREERHITTKKPGCQSGTVLYCGRGRKVTGACRKCV